MPIRPPSRGRARIGPSSGIIFIDGERDRWSKDGLVHALAQLRESERCRDRVSESFLAGSDGFVSVTRVCRVPREFRAPARL